MCGARRKGLLLITTTVSTAVRPPAGGSMMRMSWLLRTYPFGTFLRVTNLSNMKRVIVCVTDRGPFRKGRIIDVSAGAAELLDFKKKGLARVRIEVVPGKIDLSLLDLLYPKIPFLEVDHLRVRPPYRIGKNK
jgi:rare lipoprotein A